MINIHSLILDLSFEEIIVKRCLQEIPPEWWRVLQKEVNILYYLSLTCNQTFINPWKIPFFTVDGKRINKKTNIIKRNYKLIHSKKEGKTKGEKLRNLWLRGDDGRNSFHSFTLWNLKIKSTFLILRHHSFLFLST